MEYINEISYVSVSKYRTMTLVYLATHDPSFPSVIAKGTGIHKNHISTTLKQLANKELIMCLNPDVRKGKFYTITEKGKKVINSVIKDDEE